MLGDVVREDGRAARGAHARDLDEVLDRDRQPAEEAPWRKRLGGRARPLGAEGRERVDEGLDRGDAGEGGLDELERGDLALLQKGCDLAGAEPGEFFAHGGGVEQMRRPPVNRPIDRTWSTLVKAGGTV